MISFPPTVHVTNLFLEMSIVRLLQVRLFLPAIFIPLCLAKNNLIGCTAVDCPVSPGTTLSSCHVGNQSLGAVGLASYDVPIISSRPNITWTLGITNYPDPSDSRRLNIERVFYLGTPSGLDLTEDNLPYAGCAFYLTNAANKNIFYDPETTSASTSSQCQSHLGTGCESDLSNLVLSLSSNALTSISVPSTCEWIAEALNSAIPSSCSLLSAASVTGIPLTGPSASHPLTAKQNESSNCYPTLPKGNQLTREFSYNISVSAYANETAPAALGETPLLTVFYGTRPNNDSQARNAPDVQFTCLRVIDLTDAALANRTKGTEVADEASAARTKTEIRGTLLSVAFTLIIMITLSIIV